MAQRLKKLIFLNIFEFFATFFEKIEEFCIFLNGFKLSGPLSILSAFHP